MITSKNKILNNFSSYKQSGNFLSQKNTIREDFLRQNKKVYDCRKSEKEIIVKNIPVMKFVKPKENYKLYSDFNIEDAQGIFPTQNLNKNSSTIKNSKTQLQQAGKFSKPK